MRTSDRRVSRTHSPRTQAGASAVLVAVFVAFLALPLAAIGVDIARWYVELERVQAAADAAATAGVTYMPDDFDSARDRALEIAAENGFPDGGRISVVVERASRPTQLQVTISSRIDNNFGASFGVVDSTLSRTAVADYNGPAPMGSPCNTMGNEPEGSPARGPIASQLDIPPNANCSTKPQFWAGVHGPDVYKTQGDEYMTRYCQGNEDGCTNGENDDFDPLGYFYVVQVDQAAVNNPVRVQLYDAAYASTFSQCKDGYTTQPGSYRDNMNPYASNDANRRYGSTQADNFCNGDDPNNGYRHGGVADTITSFGLREPTDSEVPTEGAPMTQCVKQYPGYGTGEVNKNRLDSTKGAYIADLASVFHQWVDLCTFVPSEPGDYYLQVRTNVALGGTPDGAGGLSGNMAVFDQSGDDPDVRGTGSNRFGLRAFAPVGGVSVSSWDHMQIFANSDSATTEFNLVRVIPAAASKTLSYEFFDVGDIVGTGSGTMTILPPGDSNLSGSLQGCTGSGVRNGSLLGCAVTGITNSGFNGKKQTIKVPIPSTYTCEFSSPGGCWFRVRVSFPGATVTDATTWSAKIEGEPVRLVQ